MEKNHDDNFFNLEQLITYSKVSAAKKLDSLEEAARFLNQVTPKEAKEAWKKLKEEGF